MEIRLAKEQEFSVVRQFYHSLIDAMEDAQYKPGWEKEVYPSDADLQKALAAGNLFIGLEGVKFGIAGRLSNKIRHICFSTTHEHPPRGCLHISQALQPHSSLSAGRTPCGGASALVPLVPAPRGGADVE